MGTEPVAEAPSAGTVLSRLRGEIAAIVSLGTGALIATGYGITAARLYSVHVPPIPVLGALPTLYYLGEALEAGVIPLVLLLTVGAGWLAFLGDGAPLVEDQGADQQPALRRLGRRLVERSLYWPALTLVLIVCSWLIDVVTRQGGLGGASWAYAPVLLSVTAIVVLLARVLPQMAFAEGPVQVVRGPWENRTLAILLVALTAIIGTSVVRIVNAYYLNDSLPAAVVSANPENCTFLGPQINAGHCYFHGYYLGESNQWVFLVWKPSTGKKLDEEIAERIEREGQKGEKKEEVERKMKKESQLLTDRLLLIPRDDVLQIAVAEELESLP